MPHREERKLAEGTRSPLELYSLLSFAAVSGSLTETPAAAFADTNHPPQPDDTVHRTKVHSPTTHFSSPAKP